MSTAWPTSPPPRRSGAPRWAVALIAAVTALVIGAGVFVTLTLVNGGVANAAEVTREPVNTAGANPFMPAVGTDAPDVVAPTKTGGSFRGDTPGLYGGTRDNRTCDAAKLTRFLDSHPGQAAAWAGVLGVRTGDIDSYVSTLTPVLLRSDTSVTNHGYANGSATVVSSVLQAGTAVFVDRYGTPVVRCYCGNPLTAPTLLTSPVYVGPTWVSFNQTNITVVQNTTTVVNNYTLVDPWRNAPFVRTGGYKAGYQPYDDETYRGSPITTSPTTGDPSTSAGPTTGTSTEPGSGGTLAAPAAPEDVATCPDGTKAGFSQIAAQSGSDVNGDGRDDTAVLVKCGTQAEQVQVIDASGTVLSTLSSQTPPGSSQPARFDPQSLTLNGTTLTAGMDVFGADDTTTPTQHQTWTWTWDGTSFTMDPSSVTAVEPADPTTTQSVTPLVAGPGTTTSAPPTTTTGSTTSSSSTGG